MGKLPPANLTLARLMNSIRGSRAAHSASLYLIGLIHIDIDISDIEYNDNDSHFYGRPQKTFGSYSCLADHAESLAIDDTLCVSDTTGGGVGGV